MMCSRRSTHFFYLSYILQSQLVCKQSTTRIYKQELGKLKFITAGYCKEKSLGVYTTFTKTSCTNMRAGKPALKIIRAGIMSPKVISNGKSIQPVSILTSELEQIYWLSDMPPLTHICVPDFNW